MSVNLKKKLEGRQVCRITSWIELNEVYRWVASRNGMALLALFCFPINKDECIVVLKDGVNEKRLTTCHYKEGR